MKHLQNFSHCILALAALGLAGCQFTQSLVDTTERGVGMYIDLKTAQVEQQLQQKQLQQANTPVPNYAESGNNSRVVTTHPPKANPPAKPPVKTKPKIKVKEGLLPQKSATVKKTQSVGSSTRKPAPRTQVKTTAPNYNKRPIRTHTTPAPDKKTGNRPAATKLNSKH